MNTLYSSHDIKSSISLFSILSGYKKCLVLVRCDDQSDINSLLQQQSILGVTGNDLRNFPVVFLPGSINYADISTIMNKEKNIFITSYTGFETNDKATYYKGNYTDHFNDARDAMFSYIFALLDEIQYIAETYPSNKIYPLLSLLYNQPIEYPGGTMYLTSNNYISVPFKFVELNADSPDYTLDPKKYGYNEEIMYIIEASTDFRVAEFYNAIDTENCDFLENSVDGSSTLEMFPIGFVLDMDSYKNKLIRIFIEKLIVNYGNNVYIYIYIIY